MRTFCLAALGLSVVSARSIFHFGDSYSATSFNYQSDLPSTENPLGNPKFPGSTILGGPANWVGDFITDNPNSGGSPTFVYNYASFGARINNTLEPGNDPSHLDFTQQYQQFTSQASSGHFNASSDVISVYFGTNDINAYLDDVKAYTGIMESMITVVQSMYDQQKARRFVFFGMDPLYRTPGYANGDQPLNYTVGAAIGVLSWNIALRQQLAAWKRSKSNSDDVQYVVYDTSPAFNGPLDDPQAYGAKDSICHDQDAQTCLWFDTLHPGKAIMGEIARGFAGALDGLGFW